jgi:hypothetical protein
VDGTQVKAETSRHEALNYGRMKQAEGQLESEIRALLLGRRRLTIRRSARTGAAAGRDRAPAGSA